MGEGVSGSAMVNFNIIILSVMLLFSSYSPATPSPLERG